MILLSKCKQSFFIILFVYGCQIFYGCRGQTKIRKKFVQCLCEFMGRGITITSCPHHQILGAKNQAIGKTAAICNQDVCLFRCVTLNEP